MPYCLNGGRPKASPTHPSVPCPSMRRPRCSPQREGFFMDGSFLARNRGGSLVLPMGIREVPKDMTVGSYIGPTASEYGCLSWKGGRVDPHVYGLDPAILNAGLMKPRREFAPVADKHKPGGASLTGMKGIQKRRSMRPLLSKPSWSSR